MAKHEVEYDEQGLSKNDPWSLYEYLAEDGFGARDAEKIRESVLSWLREYNVADCDITEPMAELGWTAM